MKEKSSRAVFVAYREALQQLYSKEEAESLTYMLLDKFLDLKRRDLLLDRKITTIPPALAEAFEILLTGKPIQQIFGEASFYGRTFLVNPQVLIPRNETEELVDRVIKKHPGPNRILDIGTGSGCIAITLSLELPGSEVFALDISKTALEVAGENAVKHKAKVNFLVTDVLTEPLPVDDLDLIVSNPPYVRSSEQAAMHPNVLEHEPHLALFVADEDPLVFYQAIAEKGRQCLKPGGYLYFEINEALGGEVKSLLHSFGYRHVQVAKDLNGKIRFVWGENPNENAIRPD